MGLLGKAQTKARDRLDEAQQDVPHFEHVTWWKDPGLRKLYFYAFVLCIASATTGYDGCASPRLIRHRLLTEDRSFFNAVQNFESWQTYFNHPDGSFLGLLVALYTIGSLVSIPLVSVYPYYAYAEEDYR